MCTDVAEARFGDRTQSPNPPPPLAELRAGVAPAQPLPRPPAASCARRTVCSITRHWILLRETRGGVTGEPPPDVLAGGNVTLPRSFIALRREAITTMFFHSFFPFPLFFFLFYHVLNKMLTKN